MPSPETEPSEAKIIVKAKLVSGEELFLTWMDFYASCAEVMRSYKADIGARVIELQEIRSIKFVDNPEIKKIF